MNYKKHFIVIGSAAILCAVFFAGYNRGFKNGAVRGVKAGADAMLLRIKELGYSIEKDPPIYYSNEPEPTNWYFRSNTIFIPIIPDTTTLN